MTRVSGKCQDPSFSGGPQPQPELPLVDDFLHDHHELPDHFEDGCFQIGFFNDSLMFLVAILLNTVTI